MSTIYISANPDMISLNALSKESPSAREASIGSVVVGVVIVIDQSLIISEPSGNNGPAYPENMDNQKRHKKVNEV